ncbi:hypothetical protein, partial [Shewanella algae]|uniref:hypothetical protein n=1 Tax=Shewanella algae TaxID=38313 RepID=UPI00313DFA36
MLEPKLTPAPACSGWRVREATGLRISWRDDLMIVGLGAFRGREEALAARIAERYGVTLPSGPTRVEG